MAMILYKENYFRLLILLLIIVATSTITFSQDKALEFKHKQYNKNSKDSIYLNISPSILNTSDKIKKIPNFENLDIEIQNELKRKYQSIIYNTNDSIIYSIFSNNLKKSLEGYGFVLIETHLDSTLEEYSKNTHSLNIIQIELEEINYIDTIFKENSNSIFTKELTGISFNTWLRYNENDTLNNFIFFINQDYYPYLDGSIIEKNGEIIAEYKIREANPNNFYALAYKDAVIIGQYFFNFLMNKYVFEETKASDKNYYSIDPSSETIYFDDKPFDNFEIILN